jgi:glycerol-3-phosphate acyltransferase PlsY
VNDHLVPALIVGYALGSVPFGLLLTNMGAEGDRRRNGLGALDAPAVFSNGRRRLAAGTLVLDMGKGALAVAIGRVMAGPDGALGAGLAAVLGHLFPIWLQFRGGKGVATGLGALLAAMPGVGAIACLVWVGVVVALRISSVGALVAFAAAPVLAWLLGEPHRAVAAAFVLTVLVFMRHHANIARLLAGTEPRIGRRA